ncbi:hypothetical protein CRUP_034725, partial [Coryphaenoides rupestris]
RQHIWEDVQSQCLEQDGITCVDLHLWLRESEHLNTKLSQTVSDLTSVLYFKEAELQYWQSQVSRYRQEALGLARGSNAQKATLNHLEFTVERQAKELGALQKEHMRLREGMVDAWKEKAELVQRWMEEKKEEAARVNKYNDAQESMLIQGCTERRPKCPGDVRQHNSHFCLCQDDPVAGSGSGSGSLSGGSSSVRDRTPTACNQTEYSGTPNRAAETEHVTHTRRFPHSHRQRAAKAAAAQAQQAGGHFMWFGRHDSEDPLTPLEVLAATNCLASRI